MTQSATASIEQVDDDDAPVLDEQFFREARPMVEVHSAKAIADFKRQAGRPKSEAPKRQTTLRLDPDVLEAYKATGKGWQGRINADLRKSVGL